MTNYSYDAITNTLTVSAAFAKKASQLNTNEYRILKQLRNDNPGMTIAKAERKASANRPLNVTFSGMAEFIKQCRNSQNRLDEFQKVKELSKIQSSPYAYVRTWFLDNYANYSAQPEFDEEGFVIVKTRKEMEAEVKAKAAAAAAQVEKEAEEKTATASESNFTGIQAA